MYQLLFLAPEVKQWMKWRTCSFGDDDLGKGDREWARRWCRVVKYAKENIVKQGKGVRDSVGAVLNKEGREGLFDKAK